MARRVIIFGVEYAGLSAAARRYGVNHGAIRWRLDRGWAGYMWGEEIPPKSENRPGNHRQVKPVLVEGVAYPSIYAAQKAGHDYNTIMRRIARGVEGYKFLTKQEFEQLKGTIKNETTKTQNTETV